MSEWQSQLRMYRFVVFHMARSGPALRLEPIQ